MKKCNNCGLPETYETLQINNESCNICMQFEYKNENIDWNVKKIEFNNIIDKYRNKYDYDCIVPFSGGKDSTFTLLYLIKEYKLKPLVVQFDHHFMRSNLNQNNTNTFKKLGVDVIKFTPNWNLVKKLMLESLVRKGDFCWHCHTGIFAYPMHIALKFNVPLIIWGEPSSEYTNYYNYEDGVEYVDEERFNRYVNLGITAEDMQGMIDNDGIDKRDFKPYIYPPRKELKKIDAMSICLGSFIPWDVKKQSKIIMDELDWKGDQVEGMPWDLYSYEKIECYMQGVRDYIKYLKRGYARVTQMSAIDLRNKRISKEKAQSLINEYEGKKPHSLDIFLEYLNITENEFNEIISKTVVPPNKPKFNSNEYSKKTWDFDLWYREKK